MLTSTNGQDVIFLLTVLGGCGMGLIYDIYDLLRRFACPMRWMMALYDMVFWLSIAAVALWVILLAADGVIRIYMLVGFGLGMLLYLGGLRHLIHGIGRWIRKRFTRMRSGLSDKIKVVKK